MKKELELLSIVEVSDDYIRCSVCGKWHPIQSYNNDNGNIRTRTNCKDCYELPFDDMKSLKEKTEILYKTSEYKTLSRNLGYENHLRENVSTKNELLKEAKAYLKKIKELPDDGLFTEFNNSDEYNSAYFSKPGFPLYEKATHCDYPYDYPKSLDNKPIYFIYNN